MKVRSIANRRSCLGGLMAVLAAAALASPGTIGAQTKITASDGDLDDAFGYAIAISGDTAIVGAFFEDELGTGAGAAYVFERSGSAWVETQKLTASDGGSGLFGISVAISGDTAIVGSSEQDDVQGAITGAAYVFERSGTTWVETQKLTASDGVNGDQFGISVAISGDTAIVGANLADSNPADAGAAYVFERSGSAWVETQKLTASDPEDFDEFGAALAMSGGTVIIGAAEEQGAQSGGVYVFDLVGSTWTETQTLTPSDGGSGLFGWSVAISGDTAIIGAPHQLDEQGTGAGAVYVFDRSGSTWTETQKLLASDREEGDQFGFSVAVSPGAAIVGANAEDELAFDAGAAYEFVRSGATWFEVRKLKSPDGDANDDFGNAVAIAVDTAIIGADLDDENGTDAGAAYDFPLFAGCEDVVVTSSCSETSSTCDFDVTPTCTGLSQRIGCVRVSFSDPSVISTATLGATSESVRDRVAVTPVFPETDFCFSPELVVPADETVAFSLATQPSTNTSTAAQSRRLPLLAFVGMLPMGLTFVAARRKRGRTWLLAATFACLAAGASCGDDFDDRRVSLGTLPRVTTIQLESITAFDDDGRRLVFEGLPAPLGVVSR